MTQVQDSQVNPVPATGPTPVTTPAPAPAQNSSLDWFLRCLLLGLLISLGVNAASYFWNSRSFIDLIESNRQVEESLGWPFRFWSEAPLYYDSSLLPSNTLESSPTKREVVELFKYSALGWNLLLGLIVGAALGVVAIFFCGRLNAQQRRQSDRRASRTVAARNPGGQGFFQISIMGVLLATTVIALTVSVVSQFKAIERKTVESSNLASIGYGNLTQVLEIEFTSGVVYRYYHVPKHVFSELESADSLGRYFGKNIRTQYSYKRVTGKSTNSMLLAFYFVGPAYLFTFWFLLGRVRSNVKVALVILAGFVLICLAMSQFVRTEINQDRVLMGLFVCWLPQISAAVLLGWMLFFGRAILASPERTPSEPEAER